MLLLETISMGTSSIPSLRDLSFPLCDFQQVLKFVEVDLPQIAAIFHSIAALAEATGSMPMWCCPTWAANDSPSEVSKLQAEALTNWLSLVSKLTRPRTPMQEQVVTLMVKELQIFHPRNAEASHL